MSTLYIVIPCYNEEAVLCETAKRLKEKCLSLIEKQKISSDSKIVFVNDGSNDKTWNIIEELHASDKLFSGINLAKNKGHQNAVLAGLMTVKSLCDVSITMDADLQDDINAIDEMIDKFSEGYDVVYGVRKSRKKDSFFKRFTAEGFYKLMKKMGVDIVFNHADFRLMSKRVLDALEGYHEVNLFLRGIIPQIGFKSDVAYYERNERFAGESKYPLKKMVAFAVEGITSFSVKPLKLITKAGLLLFSLSTIAFLSFFISSFFKYIDLFAVGIICSIWAVCGIQAIFLGIVGEYIGKIYFETKGRPRYIIESFLNDKQPPDITK